MRARHSFKPTFDALPIRLVPSDTNVLLNPMNPAAIPTDTPTYFVSPMNPGSTVTSPTSQDPSTVIGTGSFNPPTPLAPTPIMA